MTANRDPSMPEQIRHYRIVRKLGEGGMGVVYAAYDERLNRPVAIKMIRDTADERARDRLMREARAAASVNHPNICQLFDIGEHEGEPFIVMELLEGESAGDRVARGALPVAEAIHITLGILTALDGLHRRGIIHRDLKPSNVFLTSTGVKLLDFGLARECRPATVSPDDATLIVGESPSPSSSSSQPLTLPGFLVGTPRYMAPEQLQNRGADERSDLFAVGTILFELVSGRPPFEADSIAGLFHAIVYEQPPALGGSTAITALNRIIHRALAKRPEERYTNANAMARDLREVMLISDAAVPTVARAMTRLIVLPFRMLRPDPETDFLAYALPDAITSSLGALRSLVVRSSLTAARFAEGDIDLKKIASEAEVDVILSGTILRAGEQLRVVTQLVEVPGGTVVWSLTSQVAIRDLFQLQDDLTQRIVESLSLPLTDREQRMLRHDVPETPRAHEFYLRGNQQGYGLQHWDVARDLYLRAIEEDPRYAPAWARLGRMYFLIGKYLPAPADNFEHSEAALKRALELNPDLPMAQNFYAQLEVILGRAPDALRRLLSQAAKGINDPQIFAGLVVSTRYCGLLDASIAAHHLARQLDPTISTSVAHTYWMAGEYERALAAIDRERDWAASAVSIILSLLGRDDEAVQKLAQARSKVAPHHVLWVDAMSAIIANESGQASALARQIAETWNDSDPEGRYFAARMIARAARTAEEMQRAIAVLDQSVDGGFFCYPAMASDPWLDRLRLDAGFASVLARAEEKHRNAARAFDAADGHKVLGVR